MPYESITKTVLRNGMRISLKQQPHMRTVSMGLFVKHGSQNEDLSTSGAAHFIEHVAFNYRYFDKQAKKAIEVLLSAGVSYEAATSKEFTRFTLTCLPDQVPQAVRALSLIIKPRKFTKAAIEHERSIILDEHSMSFSSGAAIKELLDNSIWGNQSLGLFIMGRKENLQRFNSDELKTEFLTNYTPSRMVFVALGPVEVEPFVTLVDHYFGEENDYAGKSPQPHLVPEPRMTAIPVRKDRVDLILGYPGVPFASSDQNDMDLIADILGNGVSSRLFAELREKLKMVYLVQAAPISYELGGYIAVQVNCEKARVREVYGAIQNVFEKMKTDGVTQVELDNARANRKRSILSSLGDDVNHLQQLGRKALVNQDYFVDMEVQNIDEVDVDSVNALTRRILTSENAAAVAIGLNSEELLELI